ncbi:hypothetical protein JCM11641_006330 [Rhodosporidiobolus odoratus]
MAAHTSHARGATQRSVYLDPPEFDDIETSSEEERSYKKGASKKGRKASKKQREKDQDDDEWGSPAKKRKTGKGKAKGKGKGMGINKAPKESKPKVDYLKTLPMDLLVEIFAYLLPTELLALSRTGKAYHDLLASKRSKPIWRTSRRIIEMPELEWVDFSYMAETSLFFGKKCESCDKKYSGVPDFALRVRLCKDCKKDNFIRLDKLKKIHPEYHPQLPQVVVATTRFGLKADLDYYNAHLIELQDEDDAEAEVTTNFTSQSRLGRSARSGQRALVEIDHNNEGFDKGSHVKRFVEARKNVIQEIEKDGQLMFNRYDKVKQLAAQHRRENRQIEWALYDARKKAKKAQDPPKAVIEQRQQDIRAQLAEDSDLYEDREWQCFRHSKWTQSALLNRPVQLTNEEWQEIEPDIKTLMNEIRSDLDADEAKRDAAYDLRMQWTVQVDKREKEIDSRCKSLRQKQDNRFARAAFPIRSDFLLFESIKQLALQKEPEDDFDDQRGILSDEDWEVALPLISEELDQYRLELFLHAVKLVLTVITDGDLPEDDVIMTNAEQYDDDFFDRATSLVCCDYECYTRGHPAYWPYAKAVPSRLTFFGSLSALLEHQHAQHADFEHRTSKEKKSSLHFHFSLPAEVACTVTALLQLGGLSEETATIEDLDELDKKANWTWENTLAKQKHFSTWRELLDSVYREAQRAANIKPPRNLAPPCIRYRAIRPAPAKSKKRSSYSTSASRYGHFISDDDSD